LRLFRPVVCSGVVAAAVCCGLAGAAPPAAAGPAAAAGGSWGTAQEVRGLPNYSSGPLGQVESVSCAAPGDCAAAGQFAASNGANEVFVVNQAGGSWGTAKEVPGIASLNGAGQAKVLSMSCASPGNCAAGGYYTTSTAQEAFVVNQTGGSWGAAKETAASLNTGEGAQVTSVSCASPGNCAAGGYYTTSTGAQEAFVVNQTGGSWGAAKEVPGTAALNTRGQAKVYSVSCTSPGNCSAGGSYFATGPYIGAFVVTETSGSWGTAKETAAALNTGGSAQVTSVSCASPGNCAAGGQFSTATGADEAFVVDQAGGSWGAAEEVPGTAALNIHGGAGVSSVSCASPGNCAAGGHLSGSSGQEAFVVDETGGSWGTAEETAAALNTGGSAQATSVSCASPGNCAAGGYLSGSSGLEAFVVDETGGSWGTAEVVPGTANTEVDAEVEMVSCASPGICAAGGYYMARAYSRPFVAYEAQATSTSLSLSAAKVTYGEEQAERLSAAVTAQFTGAPAGAVTIKSGTGTVCTITLASAKGSCTLTASQLAVGTHTLTATYDGNGYYNPSTSAKKTLTVVS